MRSVEIRSFAAAVLGAFIALSYSVVAEEGQKSDSDVHWAFQPVRKVSLRSTSSSEASHPIDALLAVDLEKSRLTRSKPADRVTLIRRLYFILLGVPPTPEEVDAFVKDPDSNAFERLVDRSLADARYGERWARHWLDVARFAESNGFETNRDRPNAWRYRDYVIAAFNDDKPYNRFVQEQLAGDSLGADVATGFLVGGAVDIVGSPDPVLTAQQRADELDDMASTASTAFLGLTLGCARCHNHKFDPIRQTEYYSMTAFFSGVRHGERPLPPSADQKEALAKVDSRIGELEKRLAPYQLSKASAPKRPPVTAQQNEERFAPIDARFLRFTITSSSGAEPCIDELEVFAGGRNVALASLGVKARASGTLRGFAIHQLEHLNDGQYGNSYSWIASENGRGWVQLEFPEWVRIDRVVWSRDREGVFKDRVPTQYAIETAAKADEWKKVASSDDREPYQSGGSGKPAEPPYSFAQLSAIEAAQAEDWLAELKRTRQERENLARPAMAYAGKFEKPDPTFRLRRGDPMQRRELVPPATLALFQPSTLSTNAGEQERRLALAKWITSPQNPLTARVLVNRIWQHHFGVGLVETPNDFGKAGSRPTHPELLDWLAAELVENGWSIKALQRRILTSATWQQASVARPEAIQVDAGNRLLWRFTPRRLEAEAIRDSILSITGNLNCSQGGPGFFLHEVDRENVHHYFPKEAFQPAEYRRMVYAVKIRMEQDGVFGSFDCPDGSLVMPKRSVSTTPLQALNLFNSRFILEQADAFAERLERAVGDDVSAQVRAAWRLAFHRLPDTDELSEAVRFVRSSGLTALCRAVLNSNEFIFIP